MDAIADGNYSKVLNHLFDFLAAWDSGRPVCLTSMAYSWCSAISEVSRRPGGAFIIDNLDPYLQDPNFFAPLKVAFRLVGPANNWGKGTHTIHTPHHDRVLKDAFSSDDDEVIADAACAWIVCNPRPTGSCAHSFTNRVGTPRSFPPRLRQVAIRVIGEVGLTELIGSGEEVVRLLNRLDTCAGDLHHRGRWLKLLFNVIRSTTDETLSSHYWCLLDELASAEFSLSGSEVRDVETTRLLEGAEDWEELEVMRSPKGAKDWEKLEVWMVIVWRILPEPMPGSMGDIGSVTLELLLSRPSALQRFEKLLADALPRKTKAQLGEVLDQARVGRLASEAQHPPYVSVHPSLLLF